MRNVILCLPAFFFMLSSFAQDNTGIAHDSTDKKTTSLNFDINYLTNNVYQGRKDSLTVPYLSAGVKIVTPSGLFAAATLSYVTTQSRIDATSFEVGYDFSRGNFNGGLSASSYIYNSESVNVKAELSSSIGIYTSYSFPFIQPSASAYASLGHNKPDYSATFGLEHRFATQNESFSFTPAVYLNASTQNYYDSYYETRSIKGRKNGRNVILTTTSEVLNASKFKLLDYELMGTFEYKIKGFNFYFVPTYAIPQNPAVVVTTVKGPLGGTQTKTTTENTSNSFYATVGIGYDLPLGKH